MVTDTRAEIGRVIELDPAIVILVHGGRESLLRTSRLLSLIRTDREGVIAKSWKAPFRVVKRAIYKGFLALLHGRSGDLAAALKMSGTNLDHKQFRISFDGVIEAILVRTSAHVIAVVPCGFRMRTYPWSVRTIAVIQQAISQSPQRANRVTCLDLRQQHTCPPIAFRVTESIFLRQDTRQSRHIWSR